MKLLSAMVFALALAWTSLAADGKKAKDDVSQIGDRNVGNCLNLYSIQKEMALGQQLAREVTRQSKILDDPIISEYVNRIGQSLARNSDAKVPFTFQVIDGDEVNAFALPGGYVFVYSGLISGVGGRLLARAGLFSDRQYIDRVAGEINELQSRPAHRWQSAEESSLDAWFEGNSFYRSPERSVSYYNKREVVGVLLDLRMRQ